MDPAVHDWAMYPTEINGLGAIVFVDLALYYRAPDPTRPYLLYAFVRINHPNAGGLPKETERAALNLIEDEAVRMATQEFDALFAGHIYHAGDLQLYFYGPQADGFEAALNASLVAHHRHRVTPGVKEDPEWFQYLDMLYPSHESLRFIRTLHVLQGLDEHGDDHSIPRAVTHYIYFSTAEDRRRFAESLPAGAFHLDESDREGEHPFQLAAEHETPVDLDTIHDVVMRLYRSADHHGGLYDTWDTHVETGQKEPATEAAAG
ncbi:MAG: DUF695 domain-containing protein [Capsulimonadaceae bacterium]